MSAYECGVEAREAGEPCEPDLAYPNDPARTAEWKAGWEDQDENGDGREQLK